MRPRYVEWNGVKINLLDTPGFHMFLHETRAAMLPVEAALVVVNAQMGAEAVTDRVWKFATEVNLPRVLVVNQLDHPKADSRLGRQHMIEQMQERWGRQVVQVQLPIVDEKGFHGVVDLVTMKAFQYEPDGNGRGEEIKVPEAVQADAKAAHEALVELVAEGKDELMEEFFSTGTLAEEHLIAALHEAIREDNLFPVLYASGLRNVGTDRLLEFLKAYAPAATEREPVAARGRIQTTAGNGGGVNGVAAEGQDEIVMRAVDDKAPLALYVYKTMTDPFTGQGHVLQGDQRQDEGGRHGAELHAAGVGEPGPSVCDAGAQAGGGRRAARGRPGRGGEAARDADRRHAGRQGE